MVIVQEVTQAAGCDIVFDRARDQSNCYAGAFADFWKRAETVTDIVEVAEYLELITHALILGGAWFGNSPTLSNLGLDYVKMLDIWDGGLVGGVRVIEKAQAVGMSNKAFNNIMSRSWEVFKPPFAGYFFSGGAVNMPNVVHAFEMVQEFKENNGGVIDERSPTDETDNTNDPAPPVDSGNGGPPPPTNGQTPPNSVSPLAIGAGVVVALGVAAFAFTRK